MPWRWKQSTPQARYLLSMVNSCVALGVLASSTESRDRSCSVDNFRPHWRCDGVRTPPTRSFSSALGPWTTPWEVFESTDLPGNLRTSARAMVSWENVISLKTRCSVVYRINRTGADADSVEIHVFGSFGPVWRRWGRRGILWEWLWPTRNTPAVEYPFFLVPDIANIFPVFGTLTWCSSAFSQCVIALSHWFPQLGPVVETSRRTTGRRISHHAAHLASGSQAHRRFALELSDLAFV